MGVEHFQLGELTQLIAALSQASAYPHSADSVEVRQTHISVVFLAGTFVYKVKKPVDLGFVDFTTLERRRHFCEEEVRLNSRLAPDVYLGVVPIVRDADGLRVAGKGQVVEWAVQMRRLPDDATLLARLTRGQVSPSVMELLARRIAAFHAQAAASAEIASVGRFEVVAKNARENFEQSESHVSQVVSRAVFERVRTATETELARQQKLIEARAAAGVPRDTHGDLRLEHIYLLPGPGGNAAPDEPAVAIIDCIEFNEQFRYADPVADIAFLVMELRSLGHSELAARFVESYFAASGDASGRALLPFYVAYRAAVRAKVDGIKSLETEVPVDQRSAALERARGYWLRALVELEPPERRPCLVLVAGLPGSGKSTLAAQLAEHCGFTVIRSDVVRKLLAGEQAAAPSGATFNAFGQGLYTAEWNTRTYAECLAQVERQLFEGQRVIVDASFREDEPRRVFLQAAARWNVPALGILCQADDASIRGRLASRQNDASDADWQIHQRAAAAWQPASSNTADSLQSIDTSGTREQALVLAQTALARAGLWG